MSSNVSKSVKRKRVNLSMVKKLELIKDIEEGATVKSVCEKYGVKRQTVSDIRKNKEKLEKFAASYYNDAASSKSGKVGNRKHMKTGKEESLDAAVMKWYVQERFNGVNVREELRYRQLQKSLLLTLALAILRAVKSGFGDSEIVTNCLTKFFIGRLVMQMKVAWPPFVRSWKSSLVMKSFLLSKFVTPIKQASFDAPCLKIPRYKEVRKVPRERN